MFSCSIILALIFLILYRNQGLVAQRIGIEKTNVTTKILSVVSSLTESYRDVHVMGKRYEYIKKLRVLKEDIATFEVRGQLLGFSAKYVFDVAIVVLALLIGAYSFLVSDATSGLATIAVFLAGISRLVPSVLRLQQGLVNIRGAIGSTRNFFGILEYKSDSLRELSIDDSLKSLHYDKGIQEKNRIAIEANSVSFQYISKDRPAIKKVSFQVPAGETWAIVGRSGSGKSTLVDLLLGLNDPESGSIRIFNQNPSTAINCGVVQIGYVPQKVFITSGTVKHNVSFEPSNQTDLSRVQECIKLVGLENWVQGLPNGYETHLGEGESQVSGGQRQRLGIARALYRRPDLLILDEATSSLDAESERVISEALQRMYGEITILIVAHRLSSIRNADKIIYMRHGRVIEVGSFSTLKKKIPEFKRQASIMGL
jgi:ABC-type multidrug transport system fused ATPase/permease subunit